ncbi:hypothetical protein CCZ37_07275 [Vibrio qinghaiensis]|uniref:Uncharacterized protein n=1 Tax=Vibrio qinghaiensis TaxID=2025808 RepID=A0A223MXX4_9VIBR|nr:hypothetical protein [Vibrio qinghaiensis]ASU22402.1 hypothetical protein CCZ37_07275 [Vibrio qinghaiensis]
MKIISTASSSISSITQKSISKIINLAEKIKSIRQHKTTSLNINLSKNAKNAKSHANLIKLVNNSNDYLSRNKGENVTLIKSLPTGSSHGKSLAPQIPEQLKTDK